MIDRLRAATSAGADAAVLPVYGTVRSCRRGTRPPCHSPRPRPSTLIACSGACVRRQQRERIDGYSTLHNIAA